MKTEIRESRHKNYFGETIINRVIDRVPKKTNFISGINENGDHTEGRGSGRGATVYCLWETDMEGVFAEVIPPTRWSGLDSHGELTYYQDSQGNFVLLPLHVRQRT